MRTLTFAAAAASLAAPAAAQMNPAAIGGGMVMPSAINAQQNYLNRHRATSRYPRGYDARNAAHCAEVPDFRRTMGAHSVDVLKLERMCHNLGYSTGD